MHKRVRASIAPIFMILTLALTWAAPAGVAHAGPVLDRILRAGDLRVGLDPSFPPLEATSKSGKVIGFDVDLAEEIARAMKVKLTLVEMPFQKLLPALGEGRLDMVISGVTITPERNLTVAFVGPYLLAGQTVLIPERLAGKVQSFEDLNATSYTVAAPRHTTAEAAVRSHLPQANLAAAEGEINALKLVLEGKADALVADLPFNAVMAFRHKDKGYVHLDSPFTFEPLGIAIPQGDPELANWLTNYLTILRGSGTLDRLGDRWFRDPGWMKSLP